MRIAALIVTHDDVESLNHCADAIWAQTRRPEVLVVVVNGTSHPGHIEEALNSWTADQLVIVRLRVNSGAAGGFSAGIATVLETGVADAICCFDDDAIPEPSCIEVLESTLAASETAGCVGALTTSMDGQLAWPLYQVGSTAPLATVAQACAASSAQGTISTYALSWHALLVPVSTVQRVGNVWPELFHQYEDAEYGLRVRAAGLENLVCVEARCSHPAAPHTKQIKVLGRSIYVGATSPAKEYLSVRNSLLVRHRHDGLRFWYRSLPEIALRTMFSIATQDVGQILSFLDAGFSGFLDAARGRAGPPPPRLGAL